jgi:hypothetical protein
MVSEQRKTMIQSLGSATRQGLVVEDITKWYQSHGFDTELDGPC